MKQTLKVKLDLSLKQNFNQNKAQSLKILSYTNEELKIYLCEQMEKNPYLNFNFSSYYKEDSDAFLNYNHDTPSLYDEIMEQARVSKYNPVLEICEYLLYQLDSNGYFKISYKDLLSKSPYPKNILKRNLAIVRTFEPHGVFAFDVKDCLKIQCKLSTHKEKEKALILCDYLEELVFGKYQKIKEETGLNELEIQNGYDFIKNLNPKPASNYESNTTYIQPEFLISVEDGEINIKLYNEELSISFNAVQNSFEGEDVKQFLKKQRYEVINIMNSIKKRNMTLLQIMQYICDVQKDFFLQHAGINYLTLDMIARNCNLHISTVSRAISNKSFEFENRYYAIKNLLSSSGVDDISSNEIKMEIKDIIDHEDINKPYSDEKIREILNERGIAVSRRCVCKYRESLFIYNSVKRKLLKQK